MQNNNQLRDLGNLQVTIHESGNCRIYCKSQDKKLYCIQPDYQSKLVLLICSRDGEPSHEVHNDYTFGIRKFTKEQLENWDAKALKELYKQSVGE